jgi:multimeric flavodoxin WrbA
MRVVAWNGSARKAGNTARLLEVVLEELGQAGLETELRSLAGRPLRGCTACYKCFERKDRRCALPDDGLNEHLEKMLGADGVLLGSPTYFTDVSAEMKALIDRAGMVGRANGNPYRRKAGAAVVAVRRAGAMHAFDTLNHFFTIAEMIIPGSSYWNVGVGRNPGDVDGDAEGLETMRCLGRNMAWLLERIRA